MTQSERTTSGAPRAVRAAAALVIGAVAIATVGLVAARPLHDADFEPWVVQSLDRASLQYLATTSGPVVVLGPVFIPRAAFLALAGALVVGAVVLLAVARRRSPVRNGQLRAVDPLALLVCVPASILAASTWRPGTYVATFLVNLVVALVAYGLGTLVMWPLPWPKRSPR